MITIFALTNEGKKKAEVLLSVSSEYKLCYKPKNFSKTVQETFLQGCPIIFFCATGIIFRILGPLLKTKYSDPAVIAIDEKAQYIIPLLSGHQGRANEIAKKISHYYTGSQVVITGENHYTDPVYAVGMGCERDCSVQSLENLLFQCLNQVDLSVRDIKALASIDIKHNEKGLIELSHRYQWDFQTWNKDKLSSFESDLTVKSEVVWREVGVYGVAEAAALASVECITQTKPEIFLCKQKNRQATCAIARGYLSNSLSSSN